MYSSIFINILWNQKLKIPSTFDFWLEFSDFNKIFFAMSSKYGNLFMVFFYDFYITYLLKSFLKGHVLN
jgi:hypothetical protein